MVCLRCHDEGLGLVVEYDDLWKSISERVTGGNGESQGHGQAVEGMSQPVIPEVP